MIDVSTLDDNFYNHLHDVEARYGSVVKAPPEELVFVLPYRKPRKKVSKKATSTIARINALAEDGYSVSEIADEIDLDYSWVRKVVAENKIKIFERYSLKVSIDGKKIMYFKSDNQAKKALKISREFIRKYVDTNKSYRQMTFYHGVWSEKEVGKQYMPVEQDEPAPVEAEKPASVQKTINTLEFETLARGIVKMERDKTPEEIVEEMKVSREVVDQVLLMFKHGAFRWH